MKNVGVVIKVMSVLKVKFRMADRFSRRKNPDNSTQYAYFFFVFVHRLLRGRSVHTPQKIAVPYPKWGTKSV